MRQYHWSELLSDYDCEIHYHPRKANAVANALSWKERIKPLRVLALFMNIGLDLPKQILEAHNEARKPKNVRLKDVVGMLVKTSRESKNHRKEKLEPRVDGTLCLSNRNTNGMIKVLPPKTAKEVVARERERKARTPLLMALLEDHLANFHKMADAKEMFQNLLSQLEIHGAGVSHQDANQKFLRSLPFSWSQALLHHHQTHRIRLLCLLKTLAALMMLVLLSVSSPSLSKSQKEGSSSYTDEVIHSFFANQSSTPQLDYDDLEKINDDDMEEMDLKWQTKVECFNFHKIGHFARDCRAKGNQDNKRRDARYNGNKARDNGRRPTYQDDLKSLVTIDGEDIDWSGHVEEDVQNYVMMAYSSSNSGSENEVKSCSKTCEESYARLKKLYDEQRDKLGDASVEIIAYTLALKKELHAFWSDVEIDYFKFSDGPKQTSVDESDAQTSEYTSCESESSVETTTSMPAPVENALKVVCKPKVWTDAPIIEEYESDSDDDSVLNV
uniref:Reverse transcriptase domain-containing protein n=1 Tax=Tanacetum cinerariifolium TaxID=118510 RepID=A0A699IA09_TANCI|nr:reverse transcriptase domain-containing protein [Tanacetum cinerariifolium]